MLTLRSKTPVRFEYTDGTAETAVVLSPDDDEATLVRKLQRVVWMSNQTIWTLPDSVTSLPARQPGAALVAAQAEYPPLFDAQAAEAALGAQLGWTEDMDIDHLPEA